MFSIVLDERFCFIDIFMNVFTVPSGVRIALIDPFVSIETERSQLLKGGP